MSTEASDKKATAQSLQEQQRQQQQKQHRVADSTCGSDEEILTKLKEMGLEDQLSLSFLAKFKELKLQDRPYFAPPPTINSTVEERAFAWSAEYCGYWSPSWDDRIHPYARPLPYTIPQGTECPSQRPPTAST
ncbi:hypothetical protein BHE90_009270 [Fusarium euwallaceae]|uniref:Uncharacterized protein n=1 Tax=Fusarium euwallaceae TaxID=1147111 RepID=A0A430LKP0_9HYPO|nr:hypothetical protein BHE90_009270 [Fusarium euwallaceae]